MNNRQSEQSKITALYCRLSQSGRLSPERFDKLSTEYEEEQQKVKQIIDEL